MPLYLTILYGFCILIISFLGGTLLKNNIKSPANLSLFLFAVGSVLWMIALYMGYFSASFSESLSLIFIRLAFALPCLWYFFLTAFIYYFPHKTFQIGTFLKLVLCGSAAIFFVIAAFTPLVEVQVVIKEGVLVGDVFGPFYTIYSFYFLFHLGLALAIGMRKVFQVKGLEKKKLQVALSGFWIFVFLAVMTNVILPIFNILIFQQESVMFSLFFIIPAFYSIQKYRFLNFSNTSLNLIRNLLLISGSFVIVFLVYEIFDLYFAEAAPLLRDSASFFCGLVFFLIVNRSFPELVTAGLREFRNAIIEFRTQLYSCVSYDDLQDLIDQIFSLRLNIPNSKVLTVREKNIENNVLIYLHDTFSSQLEQTKEIIVTEELRLQTQENKKDILSKLDELGASICLPLHTEGKLIGFFLLGAKEGGAPFSEEEIDEIVKLQHPLQITLMNILIQNNLHEERDFLKAVVEEKTKDLQLLIRQQSDFMAVSAHELRTPLSIAMFKLEELLDEKDRYEISQTLLAELNGINAALKNLKTLTQQLFEVQQYELGKIQTICKDINVGEFLEEIYKEFFPLMQKKSLHFSFQNNSPVPVTALLDKEKIRQVLGNLLTNASKFTPESGSIAMNLKDFSDKLMIEVEDSGKGIPDDQKKRIFEKFETLKPSMGMGIGLGLYLCKNIVNLHSGKIWVEISSLGGAKFCVELPKTQRKKDLA